MRFLSGSRSKKEQITNNAKSKSNDSIEVMVDIDKPSASGESEQQTSSEAQNSVQNKKDQNVAEQSNQQTGQAREQASNQSNGHDQPNGHRSKAGSIGETTSLLNEIKKESASSSTVNNGEIEEDRNEKITHKSILKGLIKKFLISFAVLAITYLIGYFRFSFAWILIFQVLYFISLAHRIRTKNRLLAARELEDEEKVTLISSQN